MKALRRVAVGLGAMLAALAISGVATASATELYKGEETVKAGTKLIASLETGTTSSWASTAEDPILTCTASTLEGTITSSGSSSSTVALAASHSTHSGGCSFTVDQSKNGLIEIHHIAGTMNGTVTGTGFYWTVHSPFVGACNYGFAANTHLGTLTGSTSGTATVDINTIVTEQEPKRVVCPDTGRWIAKYQVTGPDPLHVTAGEVPPKSEFYSGSETIESGTAISAVEEAATTIAFSSTGEATPITCTDSAFAGVITGVSEVKVDISHFTLSGGCSVTVNQSKNGSLDIHQIAGTPDGTITGSGFNWTIHIPLVGACNYGLGTGKVDLGTLTGKTEGTATMDINAVLVEQEPKQVLCPDTIRWTASYEITSPDPLHVTQETPMPPFTGELYSGSETVEEGSELAASLETGTTSSLASTGEDPIVTCTGSSVTGKVGVEGQVGVLDVEHLTFSGGCSVTVDQSKNGTIGIYRKVGTPNGTLRGTGFYVTVHSPFVGACNYGLGTGKVDLGTLTGKTEGTATMDVNAIVTEQAPTRILCPDTARWIANYLITSPDPLHVTLS